MRWRLNRTTAAVILTAAAVTVPCGAWYVTGSRHAEQQSRRISAAPRLEARATAARLAQRIAARLESLLAAESRRPFQHYQDASFSAPPTCPCAPQSSSPLAQGLSDPLVRAHFQIDDVGRLSVPAAQLASTTAGGAAWLSEQRSVADALECAPSLPAAIPSPAPQPEASSAPVTHVGPFRWATVPIDSQPGLVAVRKVTTPGAVLGQGFVVARDKVNEALEGGAFPALLRPGEPVHDTAAALPIEGARWHIAVDASEAIAVADARAREIHRRFGRSYLAGTAAALLLGCCVVGLVWQAERLAGQRSRFAAAAAHELRTPLAGIRLYGEMLAEGLGDPANTGTYTRRIATEADRLGRVVNNVLGYSRLERGLVSAHPKPGDLGLAVREIVTQLRPALEDRGARVELSVSAETPEAWFDRDAVAQILQNLLDNAEKYTRESADRTVHVSVAPAADRIALTVRDHGPGVPAAVRRGLFRPFARQNSPDAPAGLGLGLAIVESLARAQQARVSFREPEGGGSAFTVIFSRA